MKHLMPRKEDVANLAGVDIADVLPATAEEVLSAYSDKAPAVAMEVITQEPALFWRVGDRYYFDDCYFGGVVPIDNLDYDSTLGLYDKRMR